MTISVDAEFPESTPDGKELVSDVQHDFYIHQLEGIRKIANNEGVICTIGTGGGKRDIFQLGYINRMKNFADQCRGVFLSLYPTYALLGQHERLLKERFRNLYDELGNTGVGVLKGSKKKKLIWEFGSLAKDGFVPNLGLVGTIDKWNYLHYPSKKNKYFKPEFFYQQLSIPKVFDEIHLMHPFALQNVVLNLRREQILLEIMGEPSYAPHSFFTATPPDYLCDVLITNGMVKETGVISGVGRHSDLEIKMVEREGGPEKYDKELKQLIADSLGSNDRILVILNSRRRAFKLAFSLQESNKKLGLKATIFRVFNGWNEYNSISSCNTKKLVAVATSSAEAGVSDHFDLLITETCPSVNLIQRIGRVGRYGDQVGKVIIIPSERGREMWISVARSVFKDRYGGIRDFESDLKKLEQSFPQYQLPSSPSNLIWAIHYHINKLFDERTFTDFRINERMFAGQPYDSSNNYPTLQEAKDLYKKYRELIVKVILNSMTLRTTFPNVYYENNQYSDPVALALASVSSKLIDSGEKYTIPGFRRPESTLFTLGTLPVPYGEAIWLHRTHRILVGIDRKHQFSEVWSKIRKQLGIEKKKTSPFKYVKLEFGQLCFYASPYENPSISKPISYTIEEDDRSTVKRVGFPGFFLIIKGSGNDFRNIVEEWISSFPEQYYLELFNYGEVVYAVERSFGAAFQLFERL